MALTDLIPTPDSGTQPPNPLLAALRQPQGGALPALGPLPSLPDTAAAPPVLSGGMLKPLVTNPLAQQIQAVQSRISAYENPKPGEPGFWHKLGRISARIGNIAGDVLDPRAMALIPGTDLHRALQHGQNLEELASLQKQDQASQQQASEDALRQAQTAEIPQEMQQKMDAIRAQLAENGLQMDDQGKITPVAPTEYSPKLRSELLPKTADEAFIRENPNATAQDIQTFEKRPLTKEQADALNGTWNAIAGQYHLPQDQFREGMAAADASSLASSLNNAISRGQGAQKIIVSSGNQGSARADKAFQYNNSELDKLSTPINGLLQRFGNLETSFAQNTPQANALVAPELLTVMAGGQGSGLRMNEAEISRIVGGRSHWENLRAAAQKWSTDPASAQSITPEQNREIGMLLTAVSTKLRAKSDILNGAYEKLLDTDDPKEQRKIVADARSALSAVDASSAQSAGASGGNDRAPEGTVVKMPDGSFQVKRGGKWVKQ